MHEEVYQFKYTIFDSIDELKENDRVLLREAQGAASLAYAPYSEFQVGAAARLVNGQIIKGGNQENAAFPAGICAEGVVLAVAGSQYPNVPIQTLAISYTSKKSASDHPVAPCGVCRQSLQEFRERTGQAVRLVMSGMEGKVVVVDDASSLLPFSFKF